MEIDFIMSQTNYDKEEAIQKLEELKNPVDVVRDYLGVLPKKAKTRDASQLIHHSIRKFMEDAFSNKIISPS